MTDYIALIISFAALAVSICTAIYSHVDRRRTLHRAAREELLEAIASFDHYETSLMALTREREKADSAAEGLEEKLFEQLNCLSEQFSGLSGELREILLKRIDEVDERLLVEIRSAKQMADSSTGKLEMFFDRFKRFNENKLPELRERTEALHRSLAILREG